MEPTPQPPTQPTPILSAPAPAPAPGIFGTKIPSSVAFVVGILLFLLPFAEIKCGGTVIAKNTGLGIAMGKEWQSVASKNMLGNNDNNDKDEGGVTKKQGLNQYALLALVIGILGLVFSLLSTKIILDGKMQKKIFLIFSTIIFGCFFLPYLKFGPIGVSGIDLVFKANTFNDNPWENYILLLVPISAIIVFIFSLNDEKNSWGKIIFSWLPILILTYMLVRLNSKTHNEDSKEETGLMLMGFGYWITLVTSLVLIVINQPVRSAFLAGILAFASLIGLMLDLQKKVKTDSGGTTPKTDGGGLFGLDKLNDVKMTIDFTPWFYVAIIAFLVAAFFSYRRMTSMKT